MDKKNRDLSLSFLINAGGRYKFDRARIRKAVRELLKSKGVNGRVSLSLAVVGDRKMKEVCKKHLGEEKTTDVLAFSQLEGDSGRSLDEDELSLGEVVVSYPQAKKQAMEFYKLLDEEMEFLVCHGVLHLLGVHHD